MTSGIATIALAIVSGVGAVGCAHSFCSRAAERPAIDEQLGLLRREIDRSDSAPPLVGARILERLPALAPFACEDSLGAELARRVARSVRSHPVEFSRQLIAGIRAVQWPSETPEAGPLTAAFLLTLVRLGDEDLTSYRPSPGEDGPAPPRGLARYMAFGYLARAQVWRWKWGWRLEESEPRSALAYEVEHFLLQRLQDSRDDRELLLLQPFAQGYLYPREPDALRSNSQRSLLEAFIAELSRRLRAPPDRVSLEVALERVAELGRFAAGRGLADPAKPVLREILDAGGEFPMTSGVPGAAWDLFVAAAGALRNIEVPVPYPDASVELRDRRKRFDPWADWLDLEPAGGEPLAADARSRLRDLDAELGTLKFAPGRLYVLREEARWLPPGEAQRRFEAAVPLVLQGTQVRFSTEAMFRTSALLDMNEVDVAPRIQLALRLITTPLADVLEYDGRADDHDRFTIHQPLGGKPAVRVRTAGTLSRHPDWIEHDASLRTWLEEKAPSRAFAAGDEFADWVWAAEPAFEQLVVFHASRLPGSRPEVARSILHAWMDELRSVLLDGADGGPVPSGLAAQRLLALGELSPRAGLGAEARDLIERLRDTRHAALDANGPWRDIGWAASVARSMLGLQLGGATP